MTINYDFQTGPHDWERYEFEVDYDDIERFVDKFYTDSEVADLYISEIYNENKKVQEDFKNELDINNASELKEYMMTYGGIDWAIEELTDVCGIEIFNKSNNVNIEDYFRDDAYEEFQDSVDFYEEQRELEIKSRYW